MALPASFGTITVTGKYIDFHGNAASGTVEFAPPSNIFLKATDVDVMVVPKPISVTLDPAGSFSVVLPLTDDPDVVPAFTYSVTENVTGLRRAYDVEISTVLLPGPVDLSDLAITGSVVTGTTALTRLVADELYAPIDGAGLDEAALGEYLTTGGYATTASVTAATSGLVPNTRTVAGKALTGNVSLVKGDVGLGSVDNTSDAAKPVSTAQATAIGLKANSASPTFTGTVTGVTKAHVGLGNVDDTADASKPVSTAQAAAIALKASIASPTFTGTVSGVTKAHVGLGNADDTSDANKPVSTAQATALALKAPLASPAFTGTPTGITKTHVGLANVDNTSDANKPVSTATTTALGLRPLKSEMWATVVKSGGTWATRPTGWAGVIWVGADPDPLDMVAGDIRDVPAS